MGQTYGDRGRYHDDKNTQDTQDDEACHAMVLCEIHRTMIYVVADLHPCLFTVSVVRSCLLLQQGLMSLITPIA